MSKEYPHLQQSGCPNQFCKDEGHPLLTFHVAGWPATSHTTPRPEDENLWCMICDAWCVLDGVPQEMS